MNSTSMMQAASAVDPLRQATNKPAGTRDPKAASKAAEDFEAAFVSRMLQPMFDALPTDGMFGGGQGEQMFRSLLVDEYGKLVTARGGIGLSDAVKGQILKMQEV